LREFRAIFRYQISQSSKTDIIAVQFKTTNDKIAEQAVEQNGITIEPLGKLIVKNDKETDINRRQVFAFFII